MNNHNKKQLKLFLLKALKLTLEMLTDFTDKYEKRLELEVKYEDKIYLKKQKNNYSQKLKEATSYAHK